MSDESPDLPVPRRGVAAEVFVSSLLQTAALLLIESMSVAIALLAWLTPSNVADVVSANVLSAPLRRHVLLGAAVVCGCVCLAMAVSHVRGTPAARRIRTGILLLAPLTVVGLFPTLFVRAPWIGQELKYLALLMLTCLAWEHLWRISFSAWPRRWFVWVARFYRRNRVARWFGKYAPPLALGICILVYFLVVTRHTIGLHQRLSTTSSDLAEFDNLFFNALHGHPFRAPAIEGELSNWSALKVHAEFGLYLLLPFYAIRPGPEALLVIQTALVAATALPIYLFAAGRLGRFGAMLFGVAFLLLPVVQRPNFYDFHFTPLGMFLVAWVFVALDRSLEPAPTPRARRIRLTLLAFSVVLALLSREDIAIGLTLLGVVVMLSGRSWRIGAGIAGGALAYFVVMKFGIMPRFGTMWFDQIYDRIKTPGAKGLGSVLLTLLSNPGFVFREILIEAKLLYVLHMTVPLAMLWLRKPVLLLAALPGFFSTLLVTNRPPMYESSFQYTYLWVPYIVAASVLAVEWIAAERAVLTRWNHRRAALCALLLASTAASFQFGALLGTRSVVGGFRAKSLVGTPAEAARYRELHSLIARIPKNASVAATEAEGPHVSTRLVMYSLKFTLGTDPDYLVLGASLSNAEHARVSAALHSGQYGVSAREGSHWLVQRGASTESNAELERVLRVRQ